MKEKKLTITSKNITHKQWSILLLELNLIKQARVKEFLGLNEEILKIDLINKGLMKADTWEQIERVILRLKDATALQN